MVRQQADSSGFRIPPQAVEVEKHVIGALMLGDSDTVETAQRFLREDDFYLERHQLIFRAVGVLAASGQAADLVTVRNALERLGKYTESGGDNYLMEISAEVTSDANISEHCEIVRQRAMLRDLIRTSVEVMQDAYACQDDPLQILDRAERRVLEVAERLRKGKRGLRDMQTILADCAHQWDAMVDGKEIRVKTGVSTWDAMTGGFRIPSLNLLAADSGMGKSALALQATVCCGLPTAFFAMEMSAMEEVERLMAQQDPSLNAAGLSTPEQVRAKRTQIFEAVKRLVKVPLFVDDRRRLTTLDVEAECRRMKRKHGLGLIVVDYMQLLRPSTRERDMHKKISDASEELLNISDDLQTPILAVASLNRELHKRENKRPNKSDLRGSGELEYDAHTITFLYRESLLNARVKATPHLRGVTELIVPKVRGNLDQVGLVNFDGPRSWFFGMTEADQKAYWAFLDSERFLGTQDEKKGAKRPAKGKGTPSADWGKQTSMTAADGEPLAF